jgi:hypothetical protein
VSRALAAERGAGIWHPPVTLLPRAVREPGSAWRSLVVGYVAAFLPSIALAAGISLLAPDAPQPQFRTGSLAIFVLVVVVAPLVETLIMGAVLGLLLRFVSPTVAVLLSALGWGLAHSAMVPGWGLVIWWPFLVFSTLFVAWRQHSWFAGFAVAAATHALQNLGPGLALLFGA